jgi:sensor c-di-GMP phosphodiesterase-like protein
MEMESRGEESPEVAIVRTIVLMADNLKMGVIAEGIETAEQVSRLLAMGCRFGQGYYFSRPVDAVASEQLLLNDECVKSHRAQGSCAPEQKIVYPAALTGAGGAGMEQKAEL